MALTVAMALTVVTSLTAAMGHKVSYSFFTLRGWTEQR
jgi:hypothetical protein